MNAQTQTESQTRDCYNRDVLLYFLFACPLLWDILSLIFAPISSYQIDLCTTAFIFLFYCGCVFLHDEFVRTIGDKMAFWVMCIGLCLFALFDTQTKPSCFSDVAEAITQGVILRFAHPMRRAGAICSLNIITYWFVQQVSKKLTFILPCFRAFQMYVYFFFGIPLLKWVCITYQYHYCMNMAADGSLLCRGAYYLLGLFDDLLMNQYKNFFFSATTLMYYHFSSTTERPRHTRPLESPSSEQSTRHNP